MGTDAYRRFIRALNQLEDWHADSVRATDIRPIGSGQHDAGHAILLRNKYPGPDWRRLWVAACGDRDAQLAILTAVEDELYGLSHGPSRAGKASGLHRGTEEFRRAVAHEPGSLRKVARKFGISHTEVRRIRLREVTNV